MHRIAVLGALRLAAVSLLLGSAVAAQAATVTWTGNAGNGLWFDAGNWSGGSGIPQAGDDAVLPAPAANLTISLGGATATVASLAVSGTSTLRLQSGTLVADSLNLQGALRLSGPGMRLQLNSGSFSGLAELFLIDQAVLGCGASDKFSFSVPAGQLGNINIGESGPPGRIDCDEVEMIQFGSGIARVRLTHNQTGYRLERPDGERVTLSGDGGLTQQGADSVLPSVHAYFGPTGVVSGRLQLDGELTNSSVTVSNGGALAGSGRVLGAVSVQNFGYLMPGSPVGTLRIGSLDMGVDGFLQFDLGAPGVVGGASNDLLLVDGDASLAGRARIQSLGGFGRYRLLTVSGAVTNAPLFLDSLPAGQDPAVWQIEEPVAGQIDLVALGALQIDAQPATLSVIEGGSAVTSLTYTNVGSTGFTVNSIGFSGDAEFTRVLNTCAATPFALAPGASCKQDFQFAPQLPGQYEATLNFDTTAAAGPDSFLLQGTGNRLPPLLTPATLDFGSVAVDSQSATQQATLSNPSAAALAISSAALLDALEFDIAAQTCTGSLAPGASCSYSLRFAPLANGASSDELRVQTEAGLLTVELSGSGVQEAIFGDGFEPVPEQF